MLVCLSRHQTTDQHVSSALLNCASKLVCSRPNAALESDNDSVADGLTSFNFCTCTYAVAWQLTKLETLTK